MHDGDVIGDEFDHGKIVGDEEVGEVAPFLQFPKEVEDLGLHGDVHGGHALVADDELGFHGEGPGHAEALALASGELVRVAQKVFGGKADFLQKGNDAVPAFGGSGADAMHGKGLGESLLDGEPGVKGGVGILKDDLHALAVGKHGVGVEGGEVRTVVSDGTGSGRDEEKDGPADGGLAAAGFSHEAEGLSFGDGEVYAVHGLYGLARLAEEAAAGGEVDAEVLDLEEGNG